MRRFFARLVSLFRRRGAEREMTREIEAHLALMEEDFERRGLTPVEAKLAARRAYGGVEQAKELHRDARSFVWLEQFFKDVRYGGRNLWRSPGFTLVALTALALGIGVNATMFGIYNAVALKQLPVADAGSVVRLERRFQYGFSVYTFGYTEYQYLRDHNSVFSGLTAASSTIPVLVSIGGSAPEHLRGYAVSANYFTDLGVPARMGRTFLPDEDRTAGANPVIVLQYRFWQRRLRGDPNVIGQSIRLNGMAYTIVGVAPREFTGTDLSPAEAAFWAPLSMIDQLNPNFGAGWRVQWRDSNNPGFQILARLKHSVSRAQAQAETGLLLRQYLTGYREPRPTTAVSLRRTAYFSATDNLVFHAFAAAVLMIVGLVLAVACANVANMLLARGAVRQREIAIRLALGGGRGRVIRQLLTESILLSLLGGALGVLVSTWAARQLWAALIQTRLRDLRFDLDVSPDAHVLLYGLALSVVTGLLAGLAPALQFTRLDLHSAVKAEGSPLSGARGRSRLRGFLLAAQVTVSVLLLMVSGQLMGVLGSAFVKSADLGYETRDTYLARVSLGNDYRKDPARAARTTELLRQRLETLPELSGVAMGWPPLQGPLTVPMTVGNSKLQTVTAYASDGYFETLGIRLLEGRGFTRRESDSGGPVAVISESTARHFWPGYPRIQSPVGKHISLDLTIPQAKVMEYEVVGIAKDVCFSNITQVDPLLVYLPTGATPVLFRGLMFRIRDNRDKALAAVESAVESVDPGLARTLDMVNLEDGQVSLQRGMFRILGGFAGSLTLLSLTLAGIGIYGVMAFLVSHRTREIGIRMALGATSRGVIRSIVIQGLRPVFVGMAIGFAAAAAVVTRLRASQGIADLLLHGRFGDPVVIGELALVLAIAVIASVIPARRALRVDPAEALRHE